MKRNQWLAAGAAALTLSAFAYIAVPAVAADQVPGYVGKAVGDVARPPGQMARDADRHPAELIAFAGLKPGQSVIDLMPGTGYWTRIFSPIVGAKGHVYSFAVRERRQGGAPAPGSTAGGSAGAGSPGGADAPVAPPPQPQVRTVDPMLVPILGIQHTRGYENVLAIVSAISGYGGSVGVPTQVDMVWTVDNYHDFHNAGMGPLDMVAINKSIYRDLKPGGIYMVVDHATAPGAGFTKTESLHRSDKEAVKAEVVAAGFEFVGESNILANPADDHTKPAGDMHDKTDQYILKFRKSPNAPATDKRPGPEAMKNIVGNTFVLGTPDKRFRTIFYHADGTYQEFGMNDLKRDANSMQSAYWFWDADGHNCMLHQYDPPSEGEDICHPWSAAHSNTKLGQTFMEYGSNGNGAIVSIVKGYQYPNTTQWPKE